MRVVGALLCACMACLLSIAVTSAGQRQDATESSSAWAMVQQALADSQRVKPGMKRKDVERYSRCEDGVQFPDNTRYSYRSCDYIKLEVQFDAALTGVAT